MRGAGQEAPCKEPGRCLSFIRPGREQEAGLRSFGYP